MLYLKALNIDDAEVEYAALKSIPSDENGFTNPYCDVSFEDFVNRVIPEKLARSRGEDLPEGYVPDTDYYLWDDDTIVGLFHIRHCLNDFLRNGPGHIGYCILRSYRGKGYATAGLKLAVEIARKIIPEDEIYLSANRDNAASLRAQLSNGAYIHHEDDQKVYTRIPK